MTFHATNNELLIVTDKLMLLNSPLTRGFEAVKKAVKDPLIVVK